jgi:hypothetical protein
MQVQIGLELTLLTELTIQCWLLKMNIWHRFRYMSKVYALGAKVMCNNVVRLVGTQRTLCRENPEVMTSIGRGAKQGLEQCQKQFKHDRWNCLTIDEDSSVFGKLMHRCK